jgi:outer membrane protein assembly factor BamD (BamD/ComL family)
LSAQQRANLRSIAPGGAAVCLAERSAYNAGAPGGAALDAGAATLSHGVLTLVVHGQLQSAGFLLILGVSAVRTATADAQPARTRTLTFDPLRKEWVEEPPPPPGTPEGDLHLIRTRLKERDYRNALAAVNAFVAKYGTSHPAHPDVLIAQAEVYIARDQFDEAHATLQTFLSRYAGMSLTSEALRLEFLVAEAYLRGARRKFLGLRILPARDVGFAILDEISVDYPESEHAELAVKTKADHMYNEGDYALAELEYSRLLTEYPQSRYGEHALARSAQAALASFAGVDYDDAALIEAQDRFQQYRSRHPISARRDRVEAVLAGIRERQAEKEFRTGRYYERTEHLASALFYYRLLRAEWPESIAAQKAAERLELLGALESVAPPITESGS